MAGALSDSGMGVPVRFIDGSGMQALESPRLKLVWPISPVVDHDPTMLSIGEVLAAWRAAEREIGAVPLGGPERPAIQAKLDSLRATYHRLFDERCDRGHAEDEARMTDLRAYVAGLDRLSHVGQ